LGILFSSILCTCPNQRHSCSLIVCVVGGFLTIAQISLLVNILQFWWIKNKQMHRKTDALAHYLTPTCFGATDARSSGSSLWACWIVAQCS
jgi:hypothetical protein